MAINVHKPVITQADIDSVAKTVKNGWVCVGKEREIFEKAFAKFIGTKYAITTSSGTTALHLALLALGIGKGDEVIIPALTYVATGNAVLYTGATPIIVDVDPETWNIDPIWIEKAITKRTKAIIPVHLYGNPANMDKIMGISKKHHLKVIEDAAEATGAMIGKKCVGSIGDIGCFSFYGNKLITTGEGGMITTNSKKLADSVRHLKNHCMTTRYNHNGLGYNYEMSNLAATLGLSQLKHLNITNRRKLYKYYQTYLTNISPLLDGGVNWLTSIPFKSPKRAAKRLMEFGIETRPIFTPLNHLPQFKESYCPFAQIIYEHYLSIPTRTDLTYEQLDYIINKVTKLQ